MKSSPNVLVHFPGTGQWTGLKIQQIFDHVWIYARKIYQPVNYSLKVNMYLINIYNTANNTAIKGLFWGDNKNSTKWIVTFSRRSTSMAWVKGNIDKWCHKNLTQNYPPLPLCLALMPVLLTHPTPSVTKIIASSFPLVVWHYLCFFKRYWTWLMSVLY
jgi:hypothetical protein